MQTGDYGANRELPATWFQAITKQPDLTAITASTEAERTAALERRATGRAYDGAPPTVPHPVDQHAAPACLACHEHGARIGALVAPVMSHARRDNCLQCHVVARDPRPVEVTPPAPETEFIGMRSRRGERAWPGAPPTIPHATTMRDRCDSCHGPYGALGMRPNHPWRASCSQCHAPSAALDQRGPRGVSP
jgi:cytochrome c-type protein NapB